MKKVMKGYIAGFLTSIMIMTMAWASTSVMRELHFGVNVTLDGQVISFDDDSMPFIAERRTFLPVRAIAEAVGLNVDFNPDTNTVILESANIVPVVQATPISEPVPAPALISNSQPTPQPARYQMYAASPDVPDFGAIFGARLIGYLSRDGWYTCDILTLPTESIYEYSDILEELGFTYFSSTVDGLNFRKGATHVNIDIIDDDFVIFVYKI